MSIMKIVPFISNNSKYSRREAEELVKSGMVSINGVTAEVHHVVGDIDQIVVGGEKIDKVKTKTFLIYKPKGHISTTDDEKNRKTVLDLIPKQEVRVYPVGRLDKESRGLMILTNDGELTNRYTHPKFETKKIYEVTLDHHLKDSDQQNLLKGVNLKHGVARADKIERIDKHKIRITLHEGKNREIRRMLGKLGYRADDIERIAIGEYSLSDLRGRVWIEV